MVYLKVRKARVAIRIKLKDAFDAFSKYRPYASTPTFHKGQDGGLATVRYQKERPSIEGPSSMLILFSLPATIVTRKIATWTFLSGLGLVDREGSPL